jgi:phosphoribosylformylglycinamidine cyclo-ligase
MGVHRTVGFDLVGMVVDDIVVTGARPLFMTDYIATGKVDPVVVAEIVEGIAAACAATGTSLISGETAEHPGVMRPGEYDLAGAAVGLVERDQVLGPDRVAAGDVVIGLASSGLHSNGYSLVRAVVRDLGWDWERFVPEFGRTLGEEALEPTRLYTSAMLKLAETPGTGLHGMAHVTGGGLAANLARVLPPSLGAVVSREAWPVPPVFHVLHDAAQVAWGDLERTLNLGIGMVAIVAEAGVQASLASLAGSGQQAVPIGRVAPAADIQAEAKQRQADPADLISGTKGVAGGAVLLTGGYQE